MVCNRESLEKMRFLAKERPYIKVALSVAKCSLSPGPVFVLIVNYTTAGARFLMAPITFY